jgi:trans-aconitate 2-methyltransferase
MVGGLALAVSWSARQYVTFEEERTRPVRDLLAALPAIDARTAIDIGCGPGNSTELLAACFPAADVRGIDSSSNMIAAARERLPRLRFDIADIERWVYQNAGTAENAGTVENAWNAEKTGSAENGQSAENGGSTENADDARFDVILANAVLQWVPDHARVFPALIDKLQPGGGLAVQMPDNFDQPSHRSMREIAANGPWALKLAGAVAARTSIAAAEWYYDLIRATGCKADVWRTTYHHPLPGGAGAIVEWFKGSGLRPFIDPLDEAERTEFLQRYQEAVADAYRELPDGSVLLPFPRLFIVAVR